MLINIANPRVLPNLKIRRLDPVKDENLLREAYEWDADAPQWYTSSDSVFRPPLEKYLEMTQSENQVDIGLFDPELGGLITVDYQGSGLFEVRLSAKRGTSLDVLAETGIQVREQFLTFARYAYVWVAKKNYHVLRLCRTIGFHEDGLSMYKGKYRAKPIEWVRMSL